LEAVQLSGEAQPSPAHIAARTHLA